MKTELKQNYTVGLLGVRGYVGRAIVKLINHHPQLSLQWISSRQLKGLCLSTLEPEHPPLTIDCFSPTDLKNNPCDILILALPNGLANNYVNHVRHLNYKLVIDLSADYRFNDEWQYLVPEINGEKFVSQKSQGKTIKISNPGCYATAMQLALAPILPLIESRPGCFGVSGYSGAGTTPCATNNQKNLENNIIPYQLINHFHEKEVSFHLDTPISFTPHVADFFSGISMTVQLELAQSVPYHTLLSLYQNYYSDSELVKIQKEAATIQQVVNTHCAVIGGFSLAQDNKRLHLNCVLDNLLKGAASQAIQNINLALGLSPTLGLSTETNSFKLTA
ncbi:N-acetyl-gamma-glutamyl-phosphate reductase [Aliikangiella sp. G2MR2-5]|uniref:N-acetyl-gamma-glutamyl-phosphate reductase n=1 Tax=Aliikangiella sp. G2MR2-5 TaxID=2788943 RepID=UPI0018AA1FEE|nr:N-acetyl-gamma-glutamyl-phosphate reductase [Aliikangiella sp. G2MR2-5]